MPAITKPTLAGYSFGGYYTATDGGGTQYYTATGKSARNWDKTAATTLYAKWAANTYIVTLDCQNGTDESLSVTAIYGSAMPEIAIPTRAGHTFGGYWTAANGGGNQYYTAAGASARSWDIDGVTTLYAKWTANTYSVTMDRQGGSGGSSSVTATYGSAMPSITAPTQTGYTFGGYYTSTGGSGTQYYTATGASARNWDKTAATTLYAKWTANTYAISYDLDGGTEGADPPSSGTLGTPFSVPAPTREGHTFTGWTVTGGLDPSTARWGTTDSPDTPLESAATLCANGESGEVFFLNLTATANGSVMLTANWKQKPWPYTLVNGAATVTGTPQTSGDLIIPSALDGYSVTGIGASVFRNCTNLTSVTIPDSVTNIGANAFSGCLSLASLQLPLRFNGKTSSMAIPSGCAVTFHGFCDLAVTSAYGSPSPGVGTNAIEVFAPTTVSCHVDGVQSSGTPGVRHVCTGWTGTGSVPASGTGTNVTFEIEEDSSITWLWETNVWVGCAVSGDAAAQSWQDWRRLGDSFACPFSIGESNFTWAVSGDADGVVVDAAARTIRIPCDRPRSVSARFVTAASAVATGGEPVVWDAADKGWRPAFVETASDGLCLKSGEIGPGEVSSVEAALSGMGPGTLSFRWRVSAGRGDYARFYLDGVLQQSITRSTSWADVTFAVPAGEHTVQWTYARGNGSASGEDAVFLDDVRWQPLSLASALDTTNLVWATDGAAAWFPQTAVSHDDADAARSGEVSGDDFSGLETTLTGPGTLSWFWRLDSAAGGNSGVDVILDGDWLDAYEPTGEWTRETLEIGEGEHTIRFEFWNVGTAATITDCAWLDAVSWTPAAGEPTVIDVAGVPVPASFLDKDYPSLLEAANGDYQKALEATAANKVNTVAECYVAGLCPTNALDLFRAVISWKDGVPEISWDPELAPEEAARRTYRKYGRKSLTDPNEVWTEINGDEADFNFFKVSVEMK